MEAASSSSNYTPVEHEAMLDIIAGIPGAYESSVGSPTWQAVHSRLNSKRSKDVLHQHLAEMKSAIASAISTLSAQIPSIRVPTEAADLKDFYGVLFKELALQRQQIWEQNLSKL